MPTFRRALLLLPLLAVAIACGSDAAVTSSGTSTSSSRASSTTTVPDEPPTRTPDIAGTITSIAGRTIVVGADAAVTRTQTSTYTFDVAMLTLPADAPIGTCGPADGGEYGSFGDLAVGMYVMAWIDGPVAESYPVQATAAAVALTCG